MNITDMLTPEEKQSILQQRMKAWAADAYGHGLNKEAVLAVDPDADTSEIDNAIATIQTAYDIAEGKLQSVQASIMASAAIADDAKLNK